MFRLDPFTLIVRAIAILIVLPVHEYAHAFVAARLGDQTARGRGRLEFNPFAHIDPMGAIMMLFVGVGWAKPVPINPFYFKNRKRDMALTALAGPVSNILFGFVTSFLVYLCQFILILTNGAGQAFIGFMQQFFMILTSINISLAVFNLIPIPPLDGSKVLNAVLPERIYFKIMQYERYIFFALLIAMFLGVFDRPIAIFSNAVMGGFRFVWVHFFNFLLGIIR